MVGHGSCLEQKKQLEARGRNESMKWKEEMEGQKRKKSGSPYKIAANT